MTTSIQEDSRSTISIILGIRTSRRPKRSNYLINPLQHKAVNESESESHSAVSDSETSWTIQEFSWPEYWSGYAVNEI